MNENDFLSKIQPLTKEELKNHEPSQVWLIQSSLETKGPYKQSDLDGLIDLYTTELSECIACNLSHKRWKPFFEHKVFDQRDPKQIKPVVKEDELGSNRYFVLLEGNRKGPYSKSDIERFLDKGDLRLNDLLSADNGKSWRKVYHFPLFDRRKEVEEKPIEVASLNQEQMEKSRIFTSAMLQGIQENPGTHTAIEGALIARRRHLSKKNKKLERENTNQIKYKEMLNADVQAPSQPKRSKLFYAASFCVFALAIGVMLFPDQPKRIAKKAKKLRVVSSPDDVKEINVRDNEIASDEPAKPRARTSYKSRSRNNDISNSDLEIPTDPRYVEDTPEDYYDEEPMEEPVRRRRKRRSPSVAADDPEAFPRGDDEFDDPELPELTDLENMDLPPVPGLEDDEEGGRGIARDFDDEFTEFDPDDENFE